MDARQAVRGVLWGILVAGVSAVGLFGTAGRANEPWFWAVCIVSGAIFGIGVARIDRSLLAERARPGPGGQDYVVVYGGKLLVVATIVVAGLDVGRLHWSDAVPAWLRGVGLAFYVAGFGLAVRAMIANPFFSSVVRLQTDRGHHLIRRGPYAVVRHPGYAGILPAMLGLPLALGSWLSLVPMIAFDLLVVRRVVIEDRFLLRNLEGYPRYAREVPYRVIPRVW